MPRGRLISIFAALCTAAHAPFVGAKPGSASPRVAEGSDRAAREPGPGAKVAVLPIEIDGRLSVNDEQSLEEALVDGLRRGVFSVVTPDDVVLAYPKAVAECDARCVEEVSKTFDADYIVRAQIKVRDRDYALSVNLFDRGEEAALVQSRDACEICGISDANAMMSMAAATLRTKLDALAAGPTVVTISSSPEGADVFVDGEFVGRTPFESPLAPGRRVVRLSRDGYITFERELMIVEGMQEKHAFELEKAPSRLPSSRPWGWASIGVGSAGIVTSIAFAAVDDRPFRLGDACEKGNIDSRGECRRVWNTQHIALIAGLTGAALVTLGAAILVNKPKQRRSEDQKRARIGIGFGSLVVHGRF